MHLLNLTRVASKQLYLSHWTRFLDLDIKQVVALAQYCDNIDLLDTIAGQIKKTTTKDKRTS